jgi:hypothetical protein
VLRPRAAIMRRVDRAALVCTMDDDRYVYLLKVDGRVSLALVWQQLESSGQCQQQHEAAARRLSDSNGRAEPVASGWVQRPVCPLLCPPHATRRRWLKGSVRVNRGRGVSLRQHTYRSVMHVDGFVGEASITINSTHEAAGRRLSGRIAQARRLGCSWSWSTRCFALAPRS